ncbi:MAG: ice-binding family protein, partial [Acidimicrobiales bacterium]
INKKIFIIKRNVMTTPVILGASQSFAVLANNFITNTDPTVIDGNVGYVAPAPTGVTVNGITYTATTTPTDAAALADAQNAYTIISGSASSATPNYNTTIGPCQTITPGIYYYTGTGTTQTNVTINGNIYLDGQNNPTSQFIFYINGTLNISPNANIILINGATASNVFFVVTGQISPSPPSYQGTAITFGQCSNSVGTFITESTGTIAGTNPTTPAQSPIVMNNYAYLVGRLFSVSANPATTVASIALNSNTIVIPGPQDPLAIYKTGPNCPVSAGSQFSYNLYVYNSKQTVTTDGVTIPSGSYYMYAVDKLPCGLNYISATSGNISNTLSFNPATNTLTVALPNFQAGSSAVITVTVRACMSGCYSNSFTLKYLDALDIDPDVPVTTPPTPVNPNIYASNRELVSNCVTTTVSPATAVTLVDTVTPRIAKIGENVNIMGMLNNAINPTGNVNFTVTGKDYMQIYQAPLIGNMANVIFNTLNLSRGLYIINGFYSGDMANSSATAAPIELLIEKHHRHHERCEKSERSERSCDSSRNKHDLAKKIEKYLKY